MKKYLVLATILGVLVTPLTPSMALAEEGGFFKKRYERFQKWRDSSDEEKQAVKDTKKAKLEKRHDKWETMSDEQKAAAKNKRKDRRQVRKEKAKNKYSSLNEDQQERVNKFRAKTKDKRQNHRKKKRSHWNSLND